MDGADCFKVLRFVRLTGGMPSMTGKDPAAHMLLIRETHARDCMRAPTNS